MVKKHSPMDNYLLNDKVQIKVNTLKELDPFEEYYSKEISFWDILNNLFNKLTYKSTDSSSLVEDNEFFIVNKPQTIEDLQQENELLIQTIHQYKDRINSLELKQEENQLLRSSLIQNINR